MLIKCLGLGMWQVLGVHNSLSVYSSDFSTHRSTQITNNLLDNRSGVGNTLSMGLTLSALLEETPAKSFCTVLILASLSLFDAFSTFHITLSSSIFFGCFYFCDFSFLHLHLWICLYLSFVAPLIP